jgi:hypothetical protein
MTTSGGNLTSGAVLSRLSTRLAVAELLGHGAEFKEFAAQAELTEWVTLRLLV